MTLLLLILLLPPSTTASNWMDATITNAAALQAALATEEASTPGCANWAAAGECQANEAFMLASCPHACSAHDALPTTTTTTTDETNTNEILYYNKQGWSRIFSETLNANNKFLYCIIMCLVGTSLIIYLLRLFWKMQGPLSSSSSSSSASSSVRSVSRVNTTTISAVNSTTTTTTTDKHSKTTSFSFSYGYLVWIFGSILPTCQWLCLMISLFYDSDGVTSTR